MILSNKILSTIEFLNGWNPGIAEAWINFSGDIYFEILDFQENFSDPGYNSQFFFCPVSTWKFTENFAFSKSW